MLVGQMRLLFFAALPQHRKVFGSLNFVAKGFRFEKHLKKNLKSVCAWPSHLPVSGKARGGAAGSLGLS